MAERDFDALAARLEDPNSDLKSKLEKAVELRDSVEGVIQSGTYSYFLNKFVPILLKLLEGSPDFFSESLKQKLRSCVLEILHRLPNFPAEQLEPFLPSIVDKLLLLLRTDNEDNAILCVKIFTDFQRHFPKLVADKVQGFLDIIKDMFESMEHVVKETFSSSSPSQPPAPSIASVSSSQLSSSPRPGSPAMPPPDGADDHTQARQLLKASQSFKTIAECPIAVVSILQMHKEVVSTNMKIFVPLIKSILTCQAPPQEKAHEEAAARGEMFTGICKEIKNRTAFGDFVTAQVKTMSFLAYVLRTYAELLRDFLPYLPGVVVRLLKDCPKEKCAVRKELLVAIRHVVNFNFRKIFAKVIDDLLDERILLGDGLAVFETQRPLAYSLLADLIHHLRENLTPEQIRKAVKVYSKNLRDPFPGTSFQTMSAKLLLNMAECIAKMEDKKEARYYLISILDAIGDKFAFMNSNHKNATKISSRYEHSTNEISSRDYLASKDQPPDWDEIDIFTVSPIKTAHPRDRGADPVSDNKFLFKTLVQGLKNIFYQLRACNPPATIDAENAPPNWSDVASGFSAEEVYVLIKLFREGIQVFHYYPAEKPITDSSASPVELLASHHIVYDKEEKELLETFATVFHHIDPATFHEVFHSGIPQMYEMMFDHPALLQVPQFLLASEATSPAFAGMLLQFLMERIEDVGSSDVNKATILLRLFKLSFMAVTLFSQHNEQVLLPHVNKLVTQSIKLSTTAECPLHYFYLLRSLFRSIGGGRFEHLYKEILPLLEMLLEVLNTLISAARKTVERDLYVELSLTVPARLSNLLPHLSYLMKPLVLALRAGSELVGQGLRTLELCVDNLTADYLDPIMAPVIDDLMTALWEHLKPAPYSHFHAHTTMRILGKLGGRNRKFLDGPPTVKYSAYADPQPQFSLNFIGASVSSTFPAAVGIDLAIAKLQRETPRAPPQRRDNDMFDKEQALKLVIAEMKLVLGSDTRIENLAQLVRLQANDFYDDVLDKGVDRDFPPEREKSVAKKDSQQDRTKDLLKALFLAHAIPELKNEANDFLSEVYRHFAILEVGEALSDAKRTQRPFNVDAGEGPLSVSHRVLVDAVIEALSNERPEVREAAENAILAVRDAATTIFGSSEKVKKLPLFSQILSHCCHSCHHPEWSMKAGGSLGIKILASKFDSDASWLSEKQLEVCRALVFAAKDLPDDLPQSTRAGALETLSTVIQKCNKTATAEQVLDTSSKVHHLCSFLIFELSSTSQPVRQAVQQALLQLAELTSMEIHEIVASGKGRLQTHIFTKPLRTVVVPIQIGYIEAIAYCLKLGHGILEPNEQLTRFLRETIALAEQDEEKLTKNPSDQRNAEQIIRLRVSCLHLLSLALDIPEFSNQPENKAKPRIISAFFRFLYNKSIKVVDAANDALKAVVAIDPKLPKDILQTGLRPILMSLQDPAKLRVDGLHCLARLLQLLKNYFKVEIGSRLLDQIGKIADSQALQKASFMLIEQNEKISVVAAVFNIFHLLPDGAKDHKPNEQEPAPGAKDYISNLVGKTIELETALRRTHFSPLREPIIKYLNRFANDAWEQYFINKLEDESEGRFFTQILAAKDSKALRDVVSNDISGLVKALSPTIEGEPSAAQCTGMVNTINIVYSICASSENGKDILADESLRKALTSAGKILERQVQRDTINPNLRLSGSLAGERLMRVLTTYLTSNPEDLDFLLEVTEAVTTRNLQDVSGHLKKFVYKSIILSEDQDYWRRVADRCIAVYTSKDVTEKLKSEIMKLLLNPILAMDVKRNWNKLFDGSKGTSFVNKALLEKFQHRIWTPQAAVDPFDENVTAGIDHSRMELLQMTVLLLKYHSTLMADFRKEVVKLAWNYLKLEDVINKHGAYVLASYFLYFFEMPRKLAMSIYYFLIRAHTAEARPLVMQALEVYAEVIEKRLASESTGLPLWIRYARNPIVEDPANLLQMQNILYFIARHPDLFYEGKEIFTQLIIQSMYRIAQLTTMSLENKRSVLSLIVLIWKWEQRYHRDQGNLSPESRKRKREGTPSQSSEATSYIAAHLRLALIKYLSSFIASLTDRYPGPITTKKTKKMPNGSQLSSSIDICRKALDLFQNFLSPGYWSDLDISGMFPKVTENILLVEPKQDDKFEVSTTRVINTLHLVSAMINVKPDEWVLARLPQLKRLLEKPIKNPHPEVQEALYTEFDDQESGLLRRPLVLRVLEAIPLQNEEEEAEETDDTGKELMSFLSKEAADALSANTHIVGINILLMFSKYKPPEIDQHFSLVMKALSSIIKDHFQAATPANMVPPGHRQPDQSDPAAAEMQISLILKIIDLLAVRMFQLGDNRRPYLSALTSLVERSPSSELCLRILDLVSSWIFTPNQTFPTLKEKISVVSKMIKFEHRPDPSLFNKFLETIIQVFEDSKITRSELAIRLEPAFLIGTRTTNIQLRDRFMRLFDRHLSRSASKRALYVLAQQDWDVLADSFWLSQVIELLFGSVDGSSTVRLSEKDFRIPQPSLYFSTYAGDSRINNVMLDDTFEDFMAGHQRFCAQLADTRVKQILEPLCYLQHTDAHVARRIWKALFPRLWSLLTKDERAELQIGVIQLLTKEFHYKQVDRRPNCVQALLDGIAEADSPRINFPPHILKFMSRTYNAWYTACSYMEQNACEPVVDTQAARESNMDALAEVYAGLQEDDLFYGLWRKRSLFLDTNTALSYEQHGMWDKAQKMFEQATFKARTGGIPFSQGEYMLWEDHWVLCAQKLQQWDILADFAKNDNLNDLFLDSIWRQIEFWNSPDNRKQLENIVKGVSDALTPRRAFFQTFMSLLKLHAESDFLKLNKESEIPQMFTRALDEAIQLSIRKWHQLPKRITNAHIPILQNFQQLMEMYDANVISQTHLAHTTQANLDHKSPELKLLLSTWRDRLPNFWDDINAWQELVTWRQHIFGLINQKYLSLVPAQQSANNTNNSLVFRGFHETAWIINRFAHVARKHNLPEVCISQLSKIYTLPNIEIQEAFLKLREQAKCHYQNANEWQVGLDVINNTNLSYFGQQQKAEFYTLKGMFLARQKQNNEADEAFGSALYFDLKLPKAWAEWARYNDQLFKEDPSDITKAANALSCYLEAAGAYKNAKSRKLLARVLWLLSLDDADGTLGKTFEDFKGETPVWYWITFIPQLLTSLSRQQEARACRSVLVKLAKQFPQALYFNVRTHREDMQSIRKAHENKERAAKVKQQSSPTVKQGSPESRPATSEGAADGTSRPATSNGESAQNSQASGSNGASLPATKQEPNEDSKDQLSGSANGGTQQQDSTPKKPWEYSEEIVSVLKTANPLLALSLETMAEQLARNFKCMPDEDAYRLIVALLNDAVGYASRSPSSYATDVKLPPATESNILKFAESVLPPHIRKAFDADFVAEKPHLYDYIQKLRKWRDRFEERLDKGRSQKANLESYGPHYLTEFKFQKFVDVEVPGQYLLHRDLSKDHREQNKDFVRIERFLPDVDLSRGSNACHKRIRIRGHDGSIHPFTMQHPVAKTSRREERMLQMFRFFNDILSKRKESRRRKLQFQLPLIIPLAPAIRMIQDDPSAVSLLGVYEDHCRTAQFSKDEPILFTITKLKELQPRTADQVTQIRLQAFEAIQEKFLPNNIVLKHFQRTHCTSDAGSFDEFWLFRRQVSYSLAGLNFLTWIMHMRDRTPSKMLISRSTGNIIGTEMVPAMQAQHWKPVFAPAEQVPFRLTPNLQMLLGPIALEGVFSSALFVIAKALTEPDSGSKLEGLLSVFIRDEIQWFHTQQHRGGVGATALRESVAVNGDAVVKRALALATIPAAANTPNGSANGASSGTQNANGASGGANLANGANAAAATNPTASQQNQQQIPSLPCNQSVIDQVSRAVNPLRLSAMDVSWMPWL